MGSLMTVSVASNLVQTFAGNGSTQVFNYTHRFDETDELVVIVRSSAGVDTVKTLTTHYTVSGAGNDAGGSVTMLTAPASGETLVVYRKTEVKQEVDLANASRNDAPSVELQMDRFTRVMQDHQARLDRSVTMRPGSSGQELPEPSADKFIGWNSSATALENKTSVDLGGETLPTTANRFLHRNSAGTEFEALEYEDVRNKIDAAPYVSTRTALKALDTSKDTVAILTEQYREGAFVFDSSDHSADVTADTQEGIYVAPDSDATGASGAWVRIGFDRLDVKWFGADPGNTGDQTTAVQAWFDMVVYTETPGFLSAGIYRCTSQLDFDLAGNQNGITIEHAGHTNARISFSSAVAAPNLIIQNSSDAGIFYSRFGFHVSGDVNGKLLQIGQADFSDAFNHCMFDIVAQNANTSSGNVSVEINYTVFCEHKIVSNCSGNGNGVALDLKQCVGGLFWGGGGNADIALRMAGNTYGNTFINFDHEEVDTGTQTLTATVADNTFIGCIWSINDDEVFDFQAGSNNKIIGGTWSTYGALTAGAEGLVIDEMQERVIAASAVSASHTGDTTETTLATITIPGGTLGPNGYIEILTLWSITNNANNKSLIVRFGGASGPLFLQYVLGATATAQAYTMIQNRNSVSSQVGSHSNYGGLATSAGAVITGTVNTAADQDVLIRAQLSNSGDTITLERYVVKVRYGL